LANFPGPRPFAQLEDARFRRARGSVDLSFHAEPFVMRIAGFKAACGSAKPCFLVVQNIPALRDVTPVGTLGHT
jgi:hypothetical protein